MEFIELLCDPGNLKCTFKIQYIDLNVNLTEIDSKNYEFWNLAIT